MARRKQYDPHGVCEECGGESKRCTICCCCESAANAMKDCDAREASAERRGYMMALAEFKSYDDDFIDSIAGDVEAKAPGEPTPS